MNKTIIIYTICVVFVAAVSASTNLFTYSTTDDTPNDLKTCFKDKIGDRLADACVSMGYHHWNATFDAHGNPVPEPTENFCCGTWFSFLCGHEFVGLYCTPKEMEEFLTLYKPVVEYINEHECKNFQYRNAPPDVCRTQA